MLGLAEILIVVALVLIIFGPMIMRRERKQSARNEGSLVRLSIQAYARVNLRNLIR